MIGKEQAMRILRTAMLAVGLIALATACGNKNKKATTAPATDTAAPAGDGGDAAKPTDGDNPCGPDDGNPCQ
jgi:hypothetical protein